MTSRALPAWADEWGPVGVKCCGRRTVRVYCIGGDVIVCQVSGWGIDVCALRSTPAGASR